MPTSPDRPRVHETPQINRTTAHAGQPRQVNHDDPRNQNPSILGTSAPAARRITMSPPARHASAIVCLGRSSTGTFAGRRQARLLRDISGRQTTEIPFPHQLATGAARPPSLLSLPMLSRNSAISSLCHPSRPPGRPASILLAAEARRACGRGPLVAGRRRWGQRWGGLPQCRERFRFLGERPHPHRLVLADREGDLTPTARRRLQCALRWRRQYRRPELGRAYRSREVVEPRAVNSDRCGRRTQVSDFPSLL